MAGIGVLVVVGSLVALVLLIIAAFIIFGPDGDE